MQEQLPDFVLADLFPSNLVLVEAPIRTAPATDHIKNIPPPEPDLASVYTGPLKERPEKWYLGNNGKNISILVHEPEAAFLSEESLDFLTKILGACKLNMGDVAVINIARYQAQFLEIGAYHPEEFSNTRALVELGWGGVYVEPSPKCFKTFETF